MPSPENKFEDCDIETCLDALEKCWAWFKARIEREQKTEIRLPSTLNEFLDLYEKVEFPVSEFKFSDSDSVKIEKSKTPLSKAEIQTSTYALGYALGEWLRKKYCGKWKFADHDQGWVKKGSLIVGDFPQNPAAFLAPTMLISFSSFLPLSSLKMRRHALEMPLKQVALLLGTASVGTNTKQ